MVACEYCYEAYGEDRCKLFHGLLNADLCWAKAGWGACDLPSSTTLGLCPRHHKEIVGEPKEGVSIELLLQATTGQS